jgi:hypothetical protein
MDRVTVQVIARWGDSRALLETRSGTLLSAAIPVELQPRIDVGTLLRVVIDAAGRVSEWELDEPGDATDAAAAG